MELLLHESLSAEELANAILQKCGRDKAQSVAWHIQVLIEDETRKMLKHETEGTIDREIGVGDEKVASED